MLGEGRENLGSGPDPHLDPFRHVRLGDPASGEIRVSRIDLDGADATARWQRARHGDRRISGERADLDHVARAGEAKQDLHEARLFRRDPDGRDALGGRGALEVAQEIVLGDGVRRDVTKMLGADEGGLVGHEWLHFESDLARGVPGSPGERRVNESKLRSARGQTFDQPCAHDWSFAAGLLEAAAQVVVDHDAVLLLSFDPPYPQPSIRSAPSTRTSASPFVSPAIRARRPSHV